PSASIHSGCCASRSLCSCRCNSAKVRADSFASEREPELCSPCDPLPVFISDLSASCIAPFLPSRKSYDSLIVIGFCDNGEVMELRHLRYLVGVAHHLNYSEASRRLHVAQPAISQTILDLEEELGVKLLLRTKRTVQLTAAGSVFLREAEQILNHAKEAGQIARRAAG